RAAANASVLTMSAELERIREDNALLVADLEKKKVDLENLTKIENETQQRDLRAVTNVDRTQKQVDIVQAQLDVSEKKKNDAIIGEQAALNKALQAKIDSEAARRRSDELEETLLKARNPALREGGVGAVKPQVDRDFRATVQ